MEVVTELLGATVRSGSVPAPDADAWADLPVRYARATGAALRADASRAVLRVPGVVTVSVEGGRAVTVASEPGVAADLLRAWIHGPVLVLVAGQQGVAALHASVIALDGCGIAVAGRTGAGKSTTALGARRVGARLLAD